ncbi:MAG TPA: hypothetical protein PLC35_03200 [Methanosarcina vacuolata]|nr:hypothetical protein [Methanosarcina vacuolata]
MTIIHKKVLLYPEVLHETRLLVLTHSSALMSEEKWSKKGSELQSRTLPRWESERTPDETL